MEDMFSEDILREEAKFKPDTTKTHGLLNIDISLLFPYTNQDIVSLGFGLLTDAVLQDEDSSDSSKYLFKDTIINHRLPNKRYLTLTRKVGRVLSKTGYPIAAPLETLMSFKFLLVRFGIHEKLNTVGFPIHIFLSEETPVGDLSLTIHDWEKNSTAGKFGLDFLTHTYDASNGLYLGTRYVVGQPQFGAYPDDIQLNLIAKGDNGLFGFSPAIEIHGQPLEKFCL